MNKIAILALQGAFAEHQQMLQRLGVASVLIRNLDDWNVFMAATTADIVEPLRRGLIIPGGESTTMMKIMHDEGLAEPVSEAIKGGLPVFGTCAGMIMLDDQHLGCMDITVRRNAYGRQLGSFQARHSFQGVTDRKEGPGDDAFLMTFIRAPYIERCGPEVDVLSTLDGHIVAARQGRCLVCAFHPELNDDTRIHQLFLSML